MTTLAGPDVHPGTSTITVRPLQPTIGAEVKDIDLAKPLSTAARDEIKAAVLQYKVVFFRDQNLDRDQHAAFARQFGSLYVHPSVNKPDAGQVPAPTPTPAGGWSRPGAPCSGR
jgi:alpha-ketoglutarate-dependent sulfate ester dioxygenase